MLVLTNDDGYDAPGLAALREAVAALAADSGPARVVAPLTAESGCGHRVTTHDYLTASVHAGGVVAVSGTPADCVRLALDHLAPHPTWVLSGINAGGNLGVDVFHSGTVAAAREAVIHDVPAIAVSHYIDRGRPIDWARAARWTAPILADLIARPRTPGAYWNVNLPHPPDDAPDPEIVFCPIDPSPLELRFEVEGDRSLYRGDYLKRGRLPGTDVSECLAGRVAISLIRLFNADPLGREPGAAGG